VAPDMKHSRVRKLWLMYNIQNISNR